MKKIAKILSIVLCLAMIMGLATVAFAAESTDTQITSLDQLVTGTYKIVCTNDAKLGALDGSWVSNAESVWTITVDGTNVKLTDVNGVTIAPKGGNNNGIKSGDYNWTVACADGLFTFAGQGDDTVMLASNVESEGKFRGYKTTTISGAPDKFVSTFKLYKTDAAAGGDEPVEPAAPTEVTISKANEIGLGMEHNTFTTEKYIVTGTITEIKSTTWGNMYIQDAEGNSLYLYGLYSADGSIRFDEMDPQPAVGDTITVVGVLGNYNDAAQMKNGWLQEIVAGTPEENPEENPEEKPAYEVVTAPEAGVAYKFGMIQQNVSATDVYYLTGAMNGYYMDTTTDASTAVDVYLEATEGGYYLYTFVGEAKLYINMVVSGNYVNGAYEEAASTVYTYDTESNTLVATVNDALYWFGTRNDKTYTTVGPVKTEYNGFYMQFYAEVATGDEEGGTTVNPNNPPSTGDAIVAVVGAMLVSGVALIALPKKREF